MQVDFVFLLEPLSVNGDTAFRHGSEVIELRACCVCVPAEENVVLHFLLQIRILVIFVAAYIGTIGNIIYFTEGVRVLVILDCCRSTGTDLVNTVHEQNAVRERVVVVIDFKTVADSFLMIQFHTRIRRSVLLGLPVGAAVM